MSAPEPCPKNDDAVAFALHALEPDEEQDMRQHLPQCRSCQEMVRETEQIMGGLATSVEQIDPPAGLRDDILRRAAVTPQRRPEPSAGEPAVPNGRPSHRGDAPGRPERIDPPRRLFWTGGRRLVAASAVVVALGVGGLAAYTVQVQQERDAQIAQTQAMAELIIQLDAPGAGYAALSSTQSGDAVAAVLATPSQSAVVTAGLPRNDHDNTIYVMWGLGGAAPTPLGAFDVTTGDSAPEMHVMGPVSDGQSFAGYAISLEPGRAVPSTPTEVVASGDVQA